MLMSIVRNIQHTDILPGHCGVVKTLEATKHKNINRVRRACAADGSCDGTAGVRTR